MDEKKYDQYSGSSSDGCPYLPKQLRFKHPTTIIKLDGETIIKSINPEAVEGEYLAVFAKGASIVFKETVLLGQELATPRPPAPLTRNITEGVTTFCMCGSTMPRVGFLRLFGKRRCDQPECIINESK